MADTADLDGMSRHLNCIAIAALRVINNAGGRASFERAAFDL